MSVFGFAPVTRLHHNVFCWRKVPPFGNLCHYQCRIQPLHHLQRGRPMFVYDQWRLRSKLCFIWLCWGLVLTALRLSSGPSHSYRTRNGPFRVLQMSLWISHPRQRKEKMSFQWSIHQSHTNGWLSVIWGQLIPTCRFLSYCLAFK